jgi:hypothetical protein
MRLSNANAEAVVLKLRVEFGANSGVLHPAIVSE